MSLWSELNLPDDKARQVQLIRISLRLPRQCLPLEFLSVLAGLYKDALPGQSRSI